jgi:inner membrane protein
MEPGFWWIWVVVGILLIVLEIFTTGFVVMWFGIAAIVTAIPVYLGASGELIISTYAASVFLLTLFVRKITINFMSKNYRQLDTNVNSLLGSTGVVTQDIDYVKGTGKVRVGKEIWTAVSEQGNSLKLDTKVRVVRVQGVKLVVEKENE